jgi:hypothetical protein
LQSPGLDEALKLKKILSIRIRDQSIVMSAPIVPVYASDEDKRIPNQQDEAEHYSLEEKRDGMDRTMQDRCGETN